MEDKKCLECANSMCIANEEETEFIYKCMLSKRKEHDCKDECNDTNYFKEM